MRSENEVSEVRDRFADEASEVAEAPERWVRVFGVFLALFIVAVAAGVVLSGCGGQGTPVARTDGNEQAVAQGPLTSAEVAAATPAAPQGGLAAQDLAVREGLPPDLAVLVPDTLVSPGEAIEFTVTGTPDVTEIALADGRDEPLPFVREQGTDTWTAKYRVPLRPKQERLGLSITARNDAERWRRVWVFLRVERPDSAAATAAPVDNPDEIAHEK